MEGGRSGSRFNQEILVAVVIESHIPKRDVEITSARFGDGLNMNYERSSSINVNIKFHQLPNWYLCY